jgi:membrane-associated HD superfamily phosphohydrolase
MNNTVEDENVIVYDYVNIQDEEIINIQDNFLCLKTFLIVYSVTASILLIYSSLLIFYYNGETDESNKKSYKDLIESFILISLFLYTTSFCFYCAIKFKRY